MARVSGVSLPREKHAEIGLAYIHGIGRASSNRILTTAGANPDIHAKDLTGDEAKRLANVIAKTQTVEDDLRREIVMNIKRFQEVGCYRGIRHRESLPACGQKTETDARTCKGPRKTVANKRKQALSKVFREFSINLVLRPAEEEHR